MSAAGNQFGIFNRFCIVGVNHKGFFNASLTLPCPKQIGIARANTDNRSGSMTEPPLKIGKVPFIRFIVPGAAKHLSFTAPKMAESRSMVLHCSRAFRRNSFIFRSTHQCNSISARSDLSSPIDCLNASMVSLYLSIRLSNIVSWNHQCFMVFINSRGIPALEGFSYCPALDIGHPQLNHASAL